MRRKLCRLVFVVFGRKCFMNEYPFSGKNAALADSAEDQCFLPQADITAFGAVEITDILQDSNHSTCLRLGDRAGNHIRIVISLLHHRIISNIHVTGNNLNCSPGAGWSCPTYVAVAGVNVLLCAPLVITSWQECGLVAATNVTVLEYVSL